MNAIAKEVLTKWQKGYISGRGARLVIDLIQDQIDTSKYNYPKGVDGPEAFIREHLSKNPEDIFYRVLLVQDLMNRNLFDEALKTLEEGLSIFAENSESHKTLLIKKVKILKYFVSPDQAEELARQLLETSNSNLEHDILTSQLINILTEERRLDEAMEIAKTLPLDLDSHNVAMRAILIHRINVMKNEYDDTLYNYLVELTKMPDADTLMKVIRKLADTYNNDRNLDDTAIRVLQTLNTLEAKQLIIEKLLSRGNVSEALALSTELYNCDQNDSTVVAQYMRILIKTGNLEEAYRVGTTALQNYPDDEGIQSQLRLVKDEQQQLGTEKTSTTIAPIKTYNPRLADIPIEVKQCIIRKLISIGNVSEALALSTELYNTYQDNQSVIAQHMRALRRAGNLEEAYRVGTAAQQNDLDDEAIQIQLGIVKNEQQQLGGGNASTVIEPIKTYNPRIANIPLEAKQCIIPNLLSRKKINEALELSTGLYNANPDNLSVITQHMIVLIKAGILSGAYRIGIDALQRYPYDEGIQIQLKIVEDKQKKLRVKKPSAVIEPIKAYKPRFADIRQALYANTGNENAIIDELKKRLEENPNDLEAKFVLIEALHLSGLTTPALRLCTGIINNPDVRDVRAFNSMKEVLKQRKPMPALVRAKTDSIYPNLVKSLDI